MTTFTTQDREDAERKPMSANELADKLEKPMLDNPECPNFSRTRTFMEQVVAMLRQQQAEIEALKERNRFLESFYRTVKAQSK